MKPLRLIRINHKEFVLDEVFVSECGITVNRGFITDGISIPAILRWISSPTGRGFNAAVVHDFLLKEGYSWEYANERFAAQLECDDVPYWLRKSYVLAVEAWGWADEKMSRLWRN